MSIKMKKLSNDNSKQDILECCEMILERAKKGEIKIFYSVVIYKGNIGVYMLHNEECIHDLAVGNVLLKDLIDKQQMLTMEGLQNDNKDYVH